MEVSADGDAVGTLCATGVVTTGACWRIGFVTGADSLVGGSVLSAVIAAGVV